MDAYDNIADYYDLEHDSFSEDLDLYRQMLQEGPVLEAGVGTGRIAVPLAQSGLEVWGIDASDAMLARARERASGLGNVHLVRGDIRTIDLPVRFRAALLPLNALWHLLDSNAQLQALRAIHRHLDAAGMLLVDCSNPLTMADRGAEGTVRLRSRAPNGDGMASVYSAAWDDEAEQMLTLELWFDETSSDGVIRRRHSRLRLRYLFRAELRLLLRLAGFAVEHVYGSYDLESYVAGSPRLIAVARRP